MISKAILADVFKISKAAVTQGCRKHNTTAEEETEYRVTKYIFKHSNRIDIKRNIRQITNKFKVVMMARKEHKHSGAGKPRYAGDFTKLRQLIRKIYKQFCSTYGIEIDTTIDFNVTLATIRYFLQNRKDTLVGDVYDYNLLC